MIGLIFTDESPRQVGVDQATAIVEALSSKTKFVGVFTSAEKVLETVNAVSLHGVQFHNFDPSENILNELKARGIFSIRAFNLTDQLNARSIESSKCDLVLLDRAKGTASNGLSSNQVKQLELKRRFLVAGGILPETVKTYLQDLQPFGIDLASGVESSPGIKSELKLRQLFIEIESRVL